MNAPYIFSWSVVENNVKDNMEDGSLVHLLNKTRKIKQRTYRFNREIREMYPCLRSYKKYVKLKTAVLRAEPEDKTIDIGAELDSDEFDESTFYTKPLDSSPEKLNDGAAPKKKAVSGRRQKSKVFSGDGEDNTKTKRASRDKRASKKKSEAAEGLEAIENTSESAGNRRTTRSHSVKSGKEDVEQIQCKRRENVKTNLSYKFDSFTDTKLSDEPIDHRAEDDQSGKSTPTFYSPSECSDSEGENPQKAKKIEDQEREKQECQPVENVKHGKSKESSPILDSPTSPNSSTKMLEKESKESEPELSIKRNASGGESEGETKEAQSITLPSTDLFPRSYSGRKILAKKKAKAECKKFIHEDIAGDLSEDDAKDGEREKSTSSSPTRLANKSDKSVLGKEIQKEEPERLSENSSADEAKDDAIEVKDKKSLSSASSPTPGDPGKNTPTNKIEKVEPEITSDESSSDEEGKDDSIERKRKKSPSLTASPALAEPRRNISTTKIEKIEPEITSDESSSDEVKDDTRKVKRRKSPSLASSSTPGEPDKNTTAEKIETVEPEISSDEYSSHDEAKDDREVKSRKLSTVTETTENTQCKIVNEESTLNDESEDTTLENKSSPHVSESSDKETVPIEKQQPPSPLLAAMDSLDDDSKAMPDDTVKNNPAVTSEGEKTDDELVCTKDETPPSASKEKKPPMIMSEEIVISKYKIIPKCKKDEDADIDEVNKRVSLKDSLNEDNEEVNRVSKKLEKFYRGPPTIYPTELQSLQSTLNKLESHPVYPLHQVVDEKREESPRSSSNTSLVSKHSIKSRSRPTQLKELIEAEELIKIDAKPTLTYEDISDEDEIILMEIPKSIIDNQELEGCHIHLKKKKIIIGDTVYKVKRQINDALPCVISVGKDKSRYKKGVLQPSASIIVRQAIEAQPEASLLSTLEKCEESGHSPFPINLKQRNPLVCDADKHKSSTIVHKRKLEPSASESEKQAEKKFKSLENSPQDKNGPPKSDLNLKAQKRARKKKNS